MQGLLLADYSKVNFPRRVRVTLARLAGSCDESGRRESTFTWANELPYVSSFFSKLNLSALDATAPKVSFRIYALIAAF